MTSLKLDEIEMDKIINDASGISGGQKSRISLARATVELPEILIVDEPTASLDDNSSIAVLKYLSELPIIVIVISHHIKEQLEELFDKKIILGEVYE